MLIGFFMILVDSTIVSVANPSIMAALNTDYDAVIWVTSAYLLAYAVPLLLAGRLGDRYGPKNLYLVGLAVFTVSSLWCGLAGSIEMLIAARVVQGIGAALLTPQTLSTITRIFPADGRGVAMSVWGATAGVATLVGPLAGGVLVDGLGWQWIFFVNVPIGIVGLALAVWLIPVLPTQRHRFDVIGTVLSGAAMFLIVFGLQEGQSHDWSAWIWGAIGAGAAVMAAFVYWQSVNRHEPLVPLTLFRDRNFSLSTIGIAVIGFAVTAMMLPLMFYAQEVCGLSPTRAALLTAPMAVCTGVLAPMVGRIVDRSHPGTVIGFGFSVLAIALTWFSIEMTPTTPIWRLVLPLAGMGVAMAFIWAPLAATATRNLPPQLAGAGSGVYNATRQVGAVLGSASMAAFMTSRISAELPSRASQAPGSEGSAAPLPAYLYEPFSVAMSQSTLLPAFVALFGVVAAIFLLGSRQRSAPPQQARRPRNAAGRRPLGGADDDRTDEIAVVRDDAFGDEHAYAYRRPVSHEFVDDFIDDDDDYVEYTVSVPEPEVAPDLDDGDTEPIATRAELPLSAPAETWHSHERSREEQSADPVESWRSLLAEPKPTLEPIGFAHNGFHVDAERRFRVVPDHPAERYGADHQLDHGDVDEDGADIGARHYRPDPEARHYRVDPDPATYGRHAMPRRNH